MTHRLEEAAVIFRMTYESPLEVIYRDKIEEVPV